jgi:hypothetical protein
VNEQQTRATAATAQADAPSAATSSEPQDAWDRLAALAFGDTASEGGCSEHAHDCTCAAEQPPAEGLWPEDGVADDEDEPTG